MQQLILHLRRDITPCPHTTGPVEISPKQKASEFLSVYQLMPQVYKTQSILIAALTRLSIRETLPTLPVTVECCHLASATLQFSYSHCIKFSQINECSSHCKVWPTEKSNCGALQECWGLPHKFISHIYGKRHIFWILPVQIGRSQTTSLP